MKITLEDCKRFFEEARKSFEQQLDVEEGNDVDTSKFEDQFLGLSIAIEYLEAHPEEDGKHSEMSFPPQDVLFTINSNDNGELLVYRHHDGPPLK